VLIILVLTVDGVKLLGANNSGVSRSGAKFSGDNRLGAN